MNSIILKSKRGHSSAIVAGNGPSTIFCLHGFPDNNRSFDHQTSAFVKAGYRVIIPLIPGYEASSLYKNDDYYLSHLALTLFDWLDDLDIQKIHLIVHDWGSMIAYVASVMGPERLLSLTTLAIPHLRHLPKRLYRVPRQVLYSWYMIFFQLRVVPEWWLQRKGAAFIEQLWRDWSPGWAFSNERIESVKKTFLQDGITHAALCYYRCLADFRNPEGRKTWQMLRAPILVPTLAMTGEKDGCIHTKMFDIMMQQSDFPKGLKVERIRDAGHFLHQEKPDEVNAVILSWLQQHSA